MSRVISKCKKVMKKNFSKIFINLKGKEPTLLLPGGVCSVDYDPIQGVVIIRDSEDRPMWTIKVSPADKPADRDEWHMKCGKEEFLFYLNEDALYIVRK